MAAAGKFEPFLEDGDEDFESYIERFEQFLRATQSLAASCNFGAFLDEALRDRFVAGLKDETTQAELLKRATLTFAEACELARSIELARSETKKFQPEGQELGVHAVQRQALSSRSGQPRGDYRETRAAKETTGWACYRCGATSHTDERCPFRKYRLPRLQTSGPLGKSVPIVRQHSGGQ
ncbi:hypothetical protein MTO96_041797 [Rhipicephalus appendiculatus]